MVVVVTVAAAAVAVVVVVTVVVVVNGIALNLGRSHISHSISSCLASSYSFALLIFAFSQVNNNTKRI